MELYLMDSDGAVYVEGDKIIHDNRGHKEIYKRFHSEAEAAEYMLRLIDGYMPKKKTLTDREMNGKHKKSHRRRKPG